MSLDFAYFWYGEQTSHFVLLGLCISTILPSGGRIKIDTWSHVSVWFDEKHTFFSTGPVLLVVP